VNDQTGSLDVAEKFIAQAFAFMRAFDQSGNIRHHKIGFVIDFDDPQHRRQRCEMVGCNIGTAAETMVMILDLPTLG